MSMRAVDLTSWSAPRLHALGATETWKRSIDLKAGVDFTPGWKRLKFITPGNTIRQVSILFRGKLDHPDLQEDMRSWEGRFATYIFVSPRISSIRIVLYLAGPAVDRFSATARPISLPEYLYKTLPHSLRSPVEIVRYFYDPSFLWAISHDYPRPDVDAVSEIDRPAIAVLMPLSNPNPRFLREAIDSVRSQIYPNWRLRIVGSGLLEGGVVDYLTNLPREDPRISIALADSPARLPEILSATFGPGVFPYAAYVTALNQHDVLATGSLKTCAALLSSNPATEIVYTDHDVIDHDGRRRDPAFKPDFSLDLLYSYDYMCCQIVHRVDNFRKVGGWRDPFSCARDYDLTLRVLEGVEASQVSHIPAVLYHRRQEPGSGPTGSRADAAECFRSALVDHLARRGIAAEVLLTSAGCCRVKYAVSLPQPMVSIIIPTRDQPDLIEACVTSVLTRTKYDNFEIVIVDNGSVRPQTRALLSRLACIARVKVIAYPLDFNFAAINNFARRYSDGAFLCFLNDDTEVIDRDWLYDMVGYALQPGAGCVGAKLLYPDGTVQHAGIILGVGPGSLHAFRGFDGNALGYAIRLSVASNMSAVTGACLLLRASIFDSVGGFDEASFPITYNDVDLCAKVREMGYRNILTPFVRLYHHECRSRGYDDTCETRARLAHEFALLCARHGDRVRHDPFYSPNLSHDNANFELGLADYPVGRLGSADRG